MCKNFVLSFIVATLLSACGQVNVPDTTSLNSAETEGMAVLRGLESEVSYRGVVGTDARREILNLVNRMCVQNFRNPVCLVGPPIFNLSCPIQAGFPGIRGNDRNCSPGLIYCNYPGPSRGSCNLPDRRWFL